MEKIGIITVLYNSNDLLSDFLNSIAIQDYKNYILYLIDNTPGEATRNIIKALQVKHPVTCLKHIECARNMGAAGGNNIGIAKAVEDGCTYIILSNNDVYFNNTSLLSSAICIAIKNNLPILAPKIYYAYSNKIWWAGGGIIKWQSAVMHYGNTKEDNGEYNSSGFTGYAPTTFVLIKAGVFKTVHLLDTNYFIYVEDLDFMYRALNEGYKIWYEASLNLYHKVSSTTGGVFSNTGLYYGARNRVYFARKFYSFFQKYIAIAYVFLSLLRHALLQKRISAVRFFLNGFIKGFKITLLKATQSQW